MGVNTPHRRAIARRANDEHEHKSLILEPSQAEETMECNLILDPSQETETLDTGLEDWRSGARDTGSEG